MIFYPLGLMDRPVFRRLLAAVPCGDFGVVPQADDQIMHQKNCLKTAIYWIVFRFGNVHLKDVQRCTIPFWNDASALIEIGFGANQPCANR